jgi:solute carrier family 41
MESPESPLLPPTTSITTPIDTSQLPILSLHKSTPNESIEYALIRESLPSLMFAMAGCIMAGWVFDIVQHWVVFDNIKEMFIAVPALLGLKGNLEMNLAARMSTAANLGYLDRRRLRAGIVNGNLYLLQLQGIVIALLAGLLALTLGYITTHEKETNSEIFLLMTTTALCASISSITLGSFMCALCLLSRRFNINPDNVATPIASSFGDLITLILFAGMSRLVFVYINSLLSLFMFLGTICMIPLWIRMVLHNEHSRAIVKTGWTPLIASMLISSLAGLILERYIDKFAGMALFVPVLNGITGNLASIFTSRLSTALHSNQPEPYLRVGWVLFVLNFPTQWIFLACVHWAQLGHIVMDTKVFVVYTIVSTLVVLVLLVVGKVLTDTLWTWGYDPDNYALPYLAAIGDVVGTSMLVLAFTIVHAAPPNNT